MAVPGLHTGVEIPRGIPAYRFLEQARKVAGKCELKDREPPESFREVGCPESFCSGTLAQHAVKEHGQRDLKDREPPESFREVGCPESFCSGTLAQHADKEYGHSELEERAGTHVVNAEGGNGSDALSMASAGADFNKFGQELSDAKVDSMDFPAAAEAALSEQSEAAAGATADTDGGSCPTVVAKGRRSRRRTGQRQLLEEEALGASACEACEHGTCFTCELKVFLESIRAQAYASAHMANKPRQRVRSVLQGQCEKTAGWVAQMRAQQAEQFDTAACEALLAEIELCLMG